MIQRTSQASMQSAFSYRVLFTSCIFTACVLNACSAVPSEPVAAEMAAPQGLGDNDAQYAISTRSDRIGRIVVPVTINGQPNFHLMLDTGATHSVLTSKAIERLGLNVNDASTSTVQGVLGRVDAPMLTLDQLQAGALKLRNLHVPIMDGAVVAGLDGILGADGLNGKMITADFVHDRIRITDASSLPANGLYAIIKFALVSHRLVVVDGMVGRIPVRAVIDTGGTQTLGNLSLLLALTKVHKDQVGIDSSVIDITNSQQNGRLLLVPAIKIGPADISNAAILFSDFSVFSVWHLDKRPTLLIGMDVLGQLAELSINYGRNELQVRAR